MSADPRGFIPASDAANGIVTDLALHQECTEIERNILVQSSNGFLSTTITNTPMTSNSFYAPLTVTNVNTTNNTVTIPGLAAELAAASCMSSCRGSITGQPITFSSTDLLPSPLQTSTTYYLVPTATTDVYQLSTTKQNAFQCPAIVISLSATPSVVTGTAPITSNITATASVMGAVGVPGTLVIDGTSVTIPATDTLSQVVAAINAAVIPNVTAAIKYTYAYKNNHNCNCHCSRNLDPHDNPYNNNYNFNNNYNNGNPNLNYSQQHSHNCNNNNINNTYIASQNLFLSDSTSAAITIGAGSTAALLAALGLTAGTFGEADASGNLIIDGYTVVVNATDTLATIVANINAAAIPNVLASISAGNTLVLTDSTGAAIALASNPQAMTGTASITGTISATGNLVIDAVTVALTAADTLSQTITAINAAITAYNTANPTIPVNVIASSPSTYLVLTDSTGATITIGAASTSSILTALGFTSGQTISAPVLAALGLTAGTQAASVITATPSTLSELYYNAWKAVYFFPEQQMYTNLMADVISYFTSVGYTIIQQQQTDSSGNPIQAFQWVISW